MKKIKPFLYLHIVLLFYSLSGICSKFAAKQEFLSPKFILFYGLVIFILGVYALTWQQVLKMLPLNISFANKSITIVWGMIFGNIFFQEIITFQMVIGAIIVMIGVILAVTGNGGKADE